jgi:hypothetical protein
MCECGLPATTSVRFYILMNDNGELTPAMLQVCQTCRETMRQEDKGVW